MLQRPEVIFDLGDGACPDNDRRDTFVAQQPCQSHLGKGLAAAASIPGNLVQGVFGIAAGIAVYAVLDRSHVLARA